MVRIALAALALVFFAMPAAAHPKLLASTPADGDAVVAPGEIKLAFSEKLFSKMSGAKLVRGDAQPVSSITVNFDPDGKSMKIVPVKPLTSGSYTVEWYGVAGDTHRVTGTVHFTVR
jgi:hypothetical protein